jgi:CDP-diacylglycerol---glycerol-3-phosphate 3-phosphatidyltransferase
MRTFVLAVYLLPLIYMLAGVAIYAVRALVFRNAPIDAELEKRGSSVLIGSTLRQGFAWTARPLERLFASGGASPDSLTLAGLFMCFLGAFTIAIGDLTGGGLLILGSSGFDFLDGRVARQLGSANRGGEFLDSTLDRYSDALCFGAAAFLLRDNPWNLAAALVAFGAAGIVPYARAKAEALGADLKGGLMQRPERVVIFSAAAILSVPLDSLFPASWQAAHPTFAAMIWFQAIATAITAVSRTREGLRQIRNR